MADQIFVALQITVIGMSLVFGAILLLWLIMAALVRLMEDRPTRQPADLQADLSAAREKAAAVAIAIALAQDASLEPQEFPLPPTAIVSAWQAVRRSINLNKRGTLR